MEEERKVIKLGELFNEEELKKILVWVNKKNWTLLRNFLNSKKVSEKLMKKGVISDYLFYWFQHNFM